MTKRLPAPPPPEDRPPIPAFTPVPRRYRHDGWTPARQKAFIEALADTGCVDRAARMVNIAQTNCYTLRRAPGAESFRRAWDAALDFSVPRLKDIAFQRAIEGELIPVFCGGKLMGFRRKYNDRLLMFILRHYGQDADGKRVTVNYFSSRASAGVLRDGASTGSAPPQDERIGEEGQAAAAEASMTSVRTVISGGSRSSSRSGDAAASALEGFEGVALDPEAQAEIAAALEACAGRARVAQAAYEQGGFAAADAEEDDPDVPFVRALSQAEWRGALEPPAIGEAFEPFTPGENSWELAGSELPAEYAAWFEAEERKAAERAAEAQALPAARCGQLSSASGKTKGGRAGRATGG